MTYNVLSITENYDANKILRETQLNDAMISIESWALDVIDNWTQLAEDVFGPSYDANNDGVATLATPLTDLVAKLADNETVTGSWTFDGPVAFDDTVSSSSTFTSSGQMRARAWRTTSAQSIPTAVATAISFQAETYDVGSVHDNSVNPSRMTIPVGGAGVYQFNAQVQFAANATGRRDVLIYKNGSELARQRNIAASAGITTDINVSAQDSASVGDYYEVYVYQDSGGNLDVNFGQYTTFFSTMKVW